MFFKRRRCRNRVLFTCLWKNRISEHSRVPPIIYDISTFTSTEFGFLNFKFTLLCFSTNYLIVSLPSVPNNMYIEFIMSGRYYLYVKTIFITYTERLLLFSRLLFIGVQFYFFITLYESGIIVLWKSKNKNKNLRPISALTRYYCWKNKND